MMRISGGRSGKSGRIKFFKCPFCGHDKAWIGRGIIPQYRFKCSRCGRILN